MPIFESLASRSRTQGLFGLPPTPTYNTEHAATADTANSGPKSHRRYHLGLSKQITNDSKYNASGNTHRKGTDGMSWHIWLFVASSMTEPHVASSSHMVMSSHEGRGGVMTAEGLIAL